MSPPPPSLLKLDNWDSSRQLSFFNTSHRLTMPNITGLWSCLDIFTRRQPYMWSNVTFELKFHLSRQLSCPHSTRKSHWCWAVGNSSFTTHHAGWFWLDEKSHEAIWDIRLASTPSRVKVCVGEAAEARAQGLLQSDQIRRIQNLNRQLRSFLRTAHCSKYKSDCKRGIKPTDLSQRYPNGHLVVRI